MMTISKYFKEEEDLIFIAGQKKGIEKGEARGEHKKAVEMARQMLAEREPVDKIARYTKLPVEEISAL